MIIGQQVRNANLSQDVMTLTMTTMGINKDIRDVNSKIKSGSNDNIIDIDEDDNEISTVNSRQEAIIMITLSKSMTTRNKISLFFLSERSSLADAEVTRFSELARSVQPGNPFFRYSCNAIQLHPSRLSGKLINLPLIYIFFMIILAECNFLVKILV